jgi:site-specific DNA-methyltransferase (adenine-specific)
MTERNQTGDHPHVLVRENGDFPVVYRTKLGALYQGNCVPWLRAFPSSSVEMVFADPPFNLNKDYGKGVTDRMPDEEYLAWCSIWMKECVRILKPGGAFFLFNLPKWNIELGSELNKLGMEFRHWIACRMPKSLPIPNRLSPAHYGLLYYTKGKPTTFNSVRVPVQTCRHCGGEVKDYGGHRDKLNPAGLNLMDVFDAPEEVWESSEQPLPPGQGWTLADDLWDDIPPVRHGRYKHRSANALAPIMLERLIALATNPGDVVVDPFCGTGTTPYAAEVLHRGWLSIELGETQPAIMRLQDLAAGDRANWESGRGRKRVRLTKRGRPVMSNDPELELGDEIL